MKLHASTSIITRDILDRKNNDYSGGETADDALANFKNARNLGMHPLLGLLLRMQDKIQRLRSYANDGKLAVKDEWAEDACDDLVNYAILAKALIIEEKPVQDEFKAAPCICGKDRIYDEQFGWICRACDDEME